MNRFFKSAISFLTALIFLFTTLPLNFIILVSADNGEEAILVTNPAYEQYLIDLENNDVEKYNGFIPDAAPPMAIPELQDINIMSSNLPSVYDPRETNEITPVKDQGSAKIC